MPASPKRSVALERSDCATAVPLSRRFGLSFFLIGSALGLGACARATPALDDEPAPAGAEGPLAQPDARPVLWCDEAGTAAPGGRAEPPGAATPPAPPEASPAACPPEMVLVEGAYCPSVQHECVEWLEEPSKTAFARCARYREPAICASPERVPMRFCIDRDEYVEPGDELPLGEVSWTDAKARCERAGKRLCAEREWVFACEGEAMRPYPHGFEREAALCNFEQTELVGPDGKLRDLRVAPASRPGCLSPFGARNMVGNVDEWVVLDRPHMSAKHGGRRMMSGLKGGWWGPLRNRCRPVTVDHDEYFHELQTGFRCCAEASGAAGPGAARPAGEGVPKLVFGRGAQKSGSGWQTHVPTERALRPLRTTATRGLWGSQAAGRRAIAAAIAAAWWWPAGAAAQGAPAAGGPAAQGAPAAGEAAGEAAPESKTGSYSDYERSTIERVLARRGGALEPEPEGKAIEAIDVEVLEVIEDRDPAPGILNVLHVRSRDYVIRREVLLRPGEPYRKVIVDETARNLRRLPPLSVVICVPTRGSAPDRVRLLVIVKDIWSLRLSTDVAYTSGGLEGLVVTPIEINLLGTQQSAGATFGYAPESYTYGLQYGVPRVMGSRVAASAAAALYVNRDRGEPEGSAGAFEVGQPLYSTRTRWAWSTTASWSTRVARRYVNARLGSFDAEATPDDDRLPFQYRARSALGRALVTRSFGWAQKFDLTAGARVLALDYATPGFGAYDPRAVAEFRGRYVPASDTRVGPIVQARAYTTNFLRTFNVETLGLQEDFRLGHDLALRLYPVARAFGSSRDFLGVYAAAQYTVALGDGYARAAVESTTEHAAGGVADGLLELRGRVVTPFFGLPGGSKFVRLVYDASGLSRYRNFLNRTTFLGGDTRLRGYPSSFFVGKDFVASNLELRTVPLEVFSVLVGGASFYDVGGAFNGFDKMRVYQSVGLGLRVLFPQVNRVSFRLDAAVPLEAGGPPPGVSRFGFYAAFEQAFGTPGVTPPDDR
ncbi:MAG TPA: SUMF1/EgtB/PvdO family nonheme iron enzyme [Polyangiaceae bacterium]|nr:SUMF1/EgtB/PvdO family nonheme iron enzyme [Polyangiaceae bacterium]